MSFIRLMKDKIVGGKIQMSFIRRLKDKNQGGQAETVFHQNY
jgi:hypothetical protein